MSISGGYENEIASLKDPDDAETRPSDSITVAALLPLRNLSRRIII
jgi:hypothetical protein